MTSRINLSQKFHNKISSAYLFLASFILSHFQKGNETTLDPAMPRHDVNLCDGPVESRRTSSPRTHPLPPPPPLGSSKRHQRKQESKRSQQRLDEVGVCEEMEDNVTKGGDPAADDCEQGTLHGMSSVSGQRVSYIERHMRISSRVI
jgi:hypothetical protein